MFSYKFYPNPEKVYTIPDGVDGDIFQVCSGPLFLYCDTVSLRYWGTYSLTKILYYLDTGAPIPKL